MQNITKTTDFTAEKVLPVEKVIITLDEKIEELANLNTGIQSNTDQIAFMQSKVTEVQLEIAELKKQGVKSEKEEAEIVGIAV